MRPNTLTILTDKYHAAYKQEVGCVLGVMYPANIDKHRQQNKVAVKRKLMPVVIASNQHNGFKVLTKPIADQNVKNNAVPPALIEVR